LFTITVMPFTSDLLGKFSANPLAIDIFAANLLLATVATQLTATYGRRKDLVTPETVQQVRAARYRVAASMSVIAVSIVLAWVNPDAAKDCWLLLAVAAPPRRPLVRPPSRLNAAGQPMPATFMPRPAARYSSPGTPARARSGRPAQEPASGGNGRQDCPRDPAGPPEIHPDAHNRAHSCRCGRVMWQGR
jgi:hypothetical protein